jgi:hypothetical protein
MEEFTTESFMVLAPIVVPNVSRRAAHTARALKAVELFTRLLAIPCAAERHSLFSMSIAAQNSYDANLGMQESPRRLRFGNRSR